MKPATCCVCRGHYVKARPLQKVCSPSCALTHAKQNEERQKCRAAAEDRRQTREKLKAMETLPDLVKKAQAAFNGFIRARDTGKVCISCDKPLRPAQVGGGFDCGHYRSVGSAPHMRFVEDNAHGQCKQCNQYKAGNHVEYRHRLIDRIGLDKVEAIERDQTLRKYTREALEELARHYRAEARRIGSQT